MSRSQPPLRALILALLTLAPALLPATEAQVPGSSPYGSLVAHYFPADGGAAAPALGGPVDPASAGVHVFPTTPGGARYEVFAVGAQVEAPAVYSPTERAGSFHTTAAAEARISGATGAAVEGAHVLLLCRRFADGLESACPDVHVKTRLTTVAVTSLARLGATTRPAYTPLPPGEEPSYLDDRWVTTWSPRLDYPSQDAGAWTFGYPPAWAGLDFARAARKEVLADLVPVAAADHSLFKATYLKADAPEAFDAAAAGHPLLTIVDAQVWTKDGDLLGALREPLWKTLPPEAQAELRPVVCALPRPSYADALAYVYPGRAAPVSSHVSHPVTAAQWEALANGTFASWMRSCGAPDEVAIPWSEVVADPESARELELAARHGSLSGLGRALAKAVRDHAAHSYRPGAGVLPRTSAGPGSAYSCWADLQDPPAYPRLPCASVLPMPANVTVEPIRVQVLDGGAWVDPVQGAAVFGGPARVTARTDAWSPGGERLVVNITLVPNATEVAHAGFVVRRPGEDYTGGTVLALADQNAEGLLPEGLPSRASVMPLVTPPGEPNATWPFLAHWSKDGADALRACVRDAWSHREAGPEPNVAGPAPRFALDAPDGARCPDLLGLLDLTRLLGLRSTILEIRAGPDFALDLVLPLGTPQDALDALARGDAQALRASLPLEDLGEGVPPWDPDGALYGLVERRETPLAGRIVAVLPENLTRAALADAALSLSWTLRHAVSSVAVEIDDLPLTPTAQLVLDTLDQTQKLTQEPQVPILVPAGVLPEEVWGLTPHEKLYTITGLAAHPYVVTVGSGTTEAGVSRWTRLGPNPALQPKPDFLAPGVAGSTAVSVANALPLVEALHLSGIVGSTLVRGALAGLAIPYRGDAPVHTFYMQGYGVLDPARFVEDWLGAPLPDVPLDLLASRAGTALGTHAISFSWVNRTVPSHAADVSQLPTERDGASAFWNGTHLFVLGGHRGSPHYNLLDQIVRVNLTSGETVVLPERLPWPMNHFATVWTGEHAFLMGGNGQNGSLSVIRYTPATGSVVEMGARLPQPTYLAGVAYDGERHAYLFGRWGGHDSVYRYDTLLDNATTMGARLPHAVYGASAFWAQGRAYVLGGLANWQGRTEILEYDPVADRVTDTGLRLPEGRGGAAVAWNGTSAYLVGGTSGSITSCLSDVVRFDPAKRTVEKLDWRLDRPARYSAAAWNGTHLLSAGGGCEGSPYRANVTAVRPSHVVRDWTRFVADAPAPAGPLARAVLRQGAVQEVRDVAGILLPPGALDPLALLPSRPLRLDTPAVPLTLFSDWGVVPREHARPAEIKLLDVDGTLDAALEGTRVLLSDLGNLTSLPPAVQALLRNLTEVPVDFPERQPVTIRTRHYYLFDLLTRDLLDALQVDLTRAAAAAQGADADAAVQAILDATGAALPQPRALVDDLGAQVRAESRLGDEWPCGLDPIVRYVERMSALVDGQRSLVMAHASRTGMDAADGFAASSELSALQARGSVKAVAGSNAAGFAADLACSATNPSWIVSQLQVLRQTLEDVRAVEAALFGTTDWASKYGRAVARNETLAAVWNATAPAGLPPVADTYERLVEQHETLERLINATINETASLVARLAPTRNLETRQPRLYPATNATQTSAAPVGPYVGLTWITSHDVRVVSPFTGRVLAQGDVTVPVPSLLWNNPALDVRVEYRDGASAADAGVTVHGVDHDVFRRLALQAEVVVDGVRIPFLPKARALDLDAAANATLGLAEALGWIDANLSAAVDPRDVAAARIARDVLERIAPRPVAVPGVEALDPLLVGLYSRPVTHGNLTDGRGVARLGEVFPGRASVAYHPYAYSVRHRLEDVPPYAGADYGAVAPLHDPDMEIHRLIRDQFVGPDGAASPSELPRWAHRPPPVPASVDPGDAVRYASSVFEVDEAPLPEHHRFELDLLVGLDPLALACDALAERNAVFGTSLRAPFACPSTAAPLRAAAGLDGLVGAVCGTLAPVAQEACGAGLAAAAALGLGGGDRRDACLSEVDDEEACDALLRAMDLLAPLLDQLALPGKSDVAQVPFVRSLSRHLADRRDALGLGRDALVAAARDANPDATAAAVEAAVDKLIAGLPGLLETSVSLVPPPEVANATLVVPQALMSHGADRVAGVDWTAVALPPRSAALAQRVRDLIGAAANRTADAAVAGFALEAKSELERMGDADVSAQLDLGAAGAWLPADGPQAVLLDGQAEPVVVAVTPEELAEDAEAAGVVVEDVPPFGARFVAVAGQDNVAWTAELRAAALLEEAAKAGASALDVARAVQTAVDDAAGWRIDQGRDEVRAWSETMTPKLGAFVYGVPLAPQSHVALRTDGEAYFQNADGIMIVTADPRVKDAVLLAMDDLQDLVAATEHPGARAGALLGAVQALADAAGGDPCIRARHLNPMVRLEEWAITRSGFGREDRVLALFGGLRVQSLADSFELLTARCGGPHGASALHVVVLFYPLVDAATLEAARAWLAETSPALADRVAEGLETKVVVSGFGLTWDTYRALAPEVDRAGGEARAALSFANPWRANLEDLDLYWAFPATPDRADVDVSASSGALSLGMGAMDLLLQDPADPGRTWTLPCGDAYGGGRWYTPVLASPRGLAAHDPDALWSEGSPCRRNIVQGLLPAKWPGGAGIPLRYSVPAKSALSALQTDLNLVHQIEDTPVERILFDDPSRIAGGLGRASCWSFLYDALDPLRFMERGPACGSPAEALPAAGVVAPAVAHAQGLYREAYRIAEPTILLALELLETYLGRGFLTDVLPDASYVQRPTLGTGSPAPLHAWAVLDEADLAHLAQGGPTVTLSERAPYARSDGPPVVPVPAGELVEPMPDDGPLAEIVARLGHRLDQDGNGVEDVLDLASAELPPHAQVDVILSFADVAAKDAARAALASLDLRALADAHGVLGFAADPSEVPGRVPLGPDLRFLPLQAARVPAGLVEAVKAAAGAQRVHHDATMRALADPRPLPSQEAIRAPDARRWHAATGEGVSIAVLDTGIDARHEALDDLDDNPLTTDPKVVAWKDFVGERETPYDDHGHGTHVAGTAAGTRGESAKTFDPTGVAPGATLVVAKVLGGDGSGGEAGIIAAIDWAVSLRDEHAVAAISMSLGADLASDGTSPLEVAVDRAVEEGIVAVVAAGNAGPDPRTVGVPASARLALTVGAVDDQGRLAPFSSRGPTADGRPKPEVSAPGVLVASARAGSIQGYVRASGTSMATPHVAGAVALMAGAMQGVVDADEVRRVLMDTAARHDWENNREGAGLIDANASVGLVRLRDHDLAVQSIRLPARVLPGETVEAVVVVRNVGNHDERDVVVRLDGQARTIPLLLAASRAEVAFSWTVPPSERRYEVFARVDPSAAEQEAHDASGGNDTRLLNNERSRVVWATRLGVETVHPWTNLTARFDPARVVVALRTGGEWRPDREEDAYYAYLGALVLDGFHGQAEAVNLRAVLATSFSNGGHPLDNSAQAEVRELLLQHGSASGGSPRGVETQSGRTPFTPPLACWKMPMAGQALAHGACWMGALAPVVWLKGLAAGVSTEACGAATQAALAGTGSSAALAAAGGLGFARAVGGRALDPLFGYGTEEIDPEWAAGQTGALASAAAARGVGSLLALSACLPAPTLRLPAVMVGPGVGGLPVPVITDLVGTLPLQPVDAPLDLDLPTIPDAPRDVEASRGPGLGQIRLRWSPPEDDGGATVHDYVVHRLEGGEFAEVGRTGGALVHVDEGLADATEHTYQVRAVTVLGEGEPSANASNTTFLRLGPLAPADLAVRAGPGLRQLDASWTGVPDDLRPPATAWRVYALAADGARTLLAEVADERATLTGLDHGTWYDLVVVGVSAAGEGEASAVAGNRTFAAAPPPAVRNLSAAAGPGYGQVTVTWDAPEDDGSMPPTKYRVYRSNGTDEVLLRELSAAATRAFTDGAPPLPALPDGAVHAYRVLALNDAGPGASATVEGRAFGVPGVPANLTADATAALGEVRLSWTPLDPAAERVEAYAVYVRVAGGESRWLANATGAGHVHAGVAEETTYEYRVRAENRLGAGEFTAPVSVTTGRLSDAPSGLVAAPGDAPGEVRLEWGPPANPGGVPVQHYQIHRSRGGVRSPVANVTGTSHVDAGLASGLYEYEVRAVTAYGPGHAANASSRAQASFGPRGHAGVVPIGGLAYVLGGVLAGRTLDEVAVHDPATNATRLDLRATIPNGSSHAAVATDGRDAYVLGGAGSPGASARILRYDPRNATFEAVGQLPSGRAQAAAAYAQGKVWVFGGEDRLAPKAEIVSFDPRTGETRLLSGAGKSLPSARYGMAAATDGRYVYLFGGRTADAVLDEVVVFDAAEERVLPVADRLPSARWLAAAAWKDGRAVVMGGCADTSCRTVLDEVVKYVGAAPLGSPEVVRMGPRIPARFAAGAAWADAPVALFGCTSWGCNAARGDAWTYDPAPGKPGRPSVLPAGRGETTVAWTPPSSGTHLGAITGYRVYRGGGNAPASLDLVAEVQASSAPSFLDAGLTPGATYTYAVAAIEEGRRDGLRSDAASGGAGQGLAGRPGAPRALAAANGTDAVTLSWQPPSSDGGSAVLEYRLYRVGDRSERHVLGTAPAGATSHAVHALPRGEDVRLEVRAVNALGEGPPSAIVRARLG